MYLTVTTHYRCSMEFLGINLHTRIKYVMYIVYSDTFTKVLII